MLKRLLALLPLAALAVFSQARTMTVTSPIKNDYLGKTNTVSFNITGAEFQVKVIVKATNVATGESVTSEKDFTPTNQGTITDSLPLNFDVSAPQGAWKVSVQPVEKDGNQTFTYPNTPIIIPVTVDVKSPTFYTINPLDKTYVKGTGANQTVKITATLNEPNLDKWKVQINSGDIPNNSGTTNVVDVNWSTKGIAQDGPQSISIKVDDKAKNSATKSVSVTLDRIAPKSQIVTPGPSTYIPPNTVIPVLVEIDDQFADSLDVTGIDIVVKTLANKFIARVSRRSVTVNGNKMSFAGRIRDPKNLPKEFKLVVTAFDRAGNKATIQETRVKIGNR